MTTKKIVCFFLTFFIINIAFSKEKASRLELLSGRKKVDDRAFWDKKFSKKGYVFGKYPAKFLADNFRYIPAGAHVYDIGMSEGRNAIFLAMKGYTVTGIDISKVAIRKAKLLARENGVRINTILSSVQRMKIKPNSLDAIICFYYVDRKMNRHLSKWLKPGGILIYEAHTLKQRKVRGQENYNIKYLLREGELLNMFSGFKILKFEEPLHRQEFTASIILQKNSGFSR